MIKFEQVGDEIPKDIRVTTDDSDAELAMMQEAMEDGDEGMETWVALKNAKQNDEGQWTFIIPGDEAGEMGDIWFVVGLDSYLDELNRKALAELERDND